MATLDASLASPARSILAGDAGAILSKPARTISAGTTDIVVSAPARAVSFSLSSSPAIDAEIASIPRTIDFSVLTGAAISADLTSPARQLSASFNPDIALQLSARTLSAEVISGNTIDFARVAPAKTLTGSVIGGNHCTVAITAPVRRISASALAGSIMTLDRQLPARRITSSGTAGTIMSAALTRPMPTIDALATTPNIIDVALLIPARYISADIISTLSAEFATWVLNVRKLALTEYDNFNFNSITNFAGRVLAAGPDGIFELASQADDDGSNINTVVTTAQTDFGTSFNTRIPRIYVGYKSSGDMEFHTITSQDGTRKYLLARNGVTGIQQRRVPAGRGPKSRYWQFGFVNRDGADFMMESILVRTEKTTRRVI